MSKKMRLDKMLGNLGYGTRNEIKKDAKNGCIAVNGVIVKNASTIVDAENDTVMYKDEVVEYLEYVYLMLNKPQGVISATEDNRYETVIDLIDDFYKFFNPFPVGRLDKDTEGLLLLTNNGKLAHNLLSPKKHVDKRYYAEVDGPLGMEEIVAFKRGVKFADENYKTLPAVLEIKNSSDTSSSCYVTIKEGKFHQIKRMFESVNRNVTYLKRLTMGPLELDESLELGQYRELNEEEMSILEKYM